MQTKICKNCSCSFNKSPKDSAAQWYRRLCCSRSCSAKHRGSPWLEKFKLQKGAQLSKATQFKKGQLSGINNPNWKEKGIGYGAIHTWIQRQYGKPSFCEHCKTSQRRLYHWANVSGKYFRDRNDWLRLCVPCHKSYDINKLK